MREYRAWFSYYSEEYGTFDDSTYTVQADNPFDVRKEAWLKWDQNTDSKFQSCVKLYAVTWQPNPLDAGDYFYSHAADVKQAAGRIENVDMQNDRLDKYGKASYYEMQKHYYLGSLHTIDSIAKDLYADKGIVPPSLYEELHYARELYYQLEYGDQSNALLDKIEKAEKWDEYGYLYDMRDLFKKGYITLCGEAVVFKNQFDRNGIYPLYNDLNDSVYKYISRWERSAMTINSLARLQPIHQQDVIPYSGGHMTFDCHFLLINQNHFDARFSTPENMIWTTSEDTMNITPDYAREFEAENVITGQRALFYRNDFLGVLRPDIVARYEFEALKAEYALANQVHNNEEDTAAEDEIEP